MIRYFQRANKNDNPVSSEDEDPRDAPALADDFLALLAGDQPVPGGGAAAAHGGLLGLALLEKLLKVEQKRNFDVADQSSYWDDQLHGVEGRQEALLGLRDADSEVYNAMIQARALKTDPEAFSRLVARAVEVPVEIAETARDGLKLVVSTGRTCKRHLLADLLVICELLGASTRGALYIARANLPLFRDETRTAEMQQRLDDLNQAISDEFALTKAVIEKRIAGSS